MNRIIKASIKRSVTVCVLVVVLLAAGVLATMDMSTNLLPNIKLPMLGISVVYPGASATSVEEGVTSKIDKALQTVPGIKELETMSYDNASVAVLTFDYGTDIDEKISVIQDAFKAFTFPDGCYEPSYIKIDMNGTATATISVYNAQGDVDALTRDAKNLAAKLNGIEGVGSVEVMGTAERQVRITALEGLDITALLIVQSLSGENLNIPLGTIMQDGTTVSIRNATDATSLLDIMRLPAELNLGSSVINSFALLKRVVMEYLTCTLEEFNSYIDSALDAKSVIEDIEGKQASELEEQQHGLVAVKSLMTLVRTNSAPSLRLMWPTIERIISNEDFKSMSDDDLQALADQYGVSVDALKWLRDTDGETVKQDWDKIVAFRALVDDKNKLEDTSYEITYDNFADLFQDGGYLDVNQQQHFDGLDILHSDEYSHDEAVDICTFADKVNTVAYADIVQTVRNGEEITDAQFAALFASVSPANGFAALMSPQVIHVIRSDNFYVEDDDSCIVSVLTSYKTARVNEKGNPIYANGAEITLNDDGKQIVELNGTEYLFVNSFGRLVDSNNSIVDKNGNIVHLTDDEIAANYYSYGEYVVYSDTELVELYQKLNLGLDFGITPTTDVVRFARICQFDSGSDKLLVPLSYIGHIAFYENNDAYAQYNGLLSVTIEVYAVSDANTTDVVNAVKKVLANFESDSVVKLLDDKAGFINDSISNVLTSIVIGGVLAVLVIYLFVRKIGSSLIVSITMPLSVLVALVGLWVMNISLNLVSLGGLAVGIGMLVDNSIVVLESITKRRDAGENVADSCLHGTREVAGSLLASTLTNVCVFFPILFARGLTREIFYDLVWAVLFSIVMSLLVAVTVIPSLYHLIYKNPLRKRHAFEANEPRSNNTDKKAQRIAKRQARNKRIKSRLHRISINRMENAYGNILTKVLTKRVIVCVVALVLFGASIALVFTTGTEFMPGVDKGIIEINVEFDTSVTLEQAQDTSKHIADTVSAHYGNKLEYLAMTVGKQGILATANSGVIRIQIDTAQLKTSETVQEIRQLIKQEGVSAKSVTVREMDGVIAEVTGGMSGQSVSLLGDDMDTLRAAAAKVREKLLVADPSHIVSAVDNTPELTTQISFTFDRMLCAERGVDYQTAVMLLRVGMSGYSAANVNIDGESCDVSVQFVDATKDNLDALTNIVVGFDADGAILLCDVLVKADDGKLYTTEEVANTIHKKDGKYFTSIDLEIYGIDSGTIGKTISKVVKETLAEFDGVEYREGGVASYLNDAFTGLVISLIAAFVLLYSVMACQFESLTKPFIVIMSIPFSFTGGFLALAITGMTLNVVSFVGLIMLMGVIVNGAIVMIDKINMLIEEGMEPQQAVVEGCKSRLRPILMTTLTTILALVPLALGLGRGGELMQPMGIVVLGGLLLGTLVTLVLIPCFYCIVKRIKFNSKGKVVKSDVATSDTVENQ
ncbi:MAG: efflux RND transporter permease subunit [Clostridiales bacterium]|nr:efflux RND transporter permease subunit [Clostridiales bacterium]